MLEHAYQEFVHGDLKQSQEEARRGYQEFLRSSPEWAWQFGILEAKAALWRGLYGDVTEILSQLPDFADRPDLAIQKLTLLGVVSVNIHDFAAAKRSLTDAAALCSTSSHASCGYVLQARGLLASELDQSAAAERFYELSLAFARSNNDVFLETDSLLNLGAESLALGHFDEAIDRSEAAYRLAKATDAKSLELVTQGNLGWAYYKLGDSERALELLLEAEKTAAEVGAVFDQENELTNIGYIYMDSRNFDLAPKFFQRALDLAEGIEAKQDVYNALRVLARLALQTGEQGKASDYAVRALTLARESGNHLDELYPMLVQGQVAAQRGDVAKARQVFEAVEQDQVSPSSLKWEAQHSLALLYEDERLPDATDHEYRAALATFQAARCGLHERVDSRLSFLSNAARIYEDYIHFLVAAGKTNDALRVADYSRARTLAEGLGSTCRAKFAPDALDAPEIARRAGGTILFYALGQEHSYLWAITPHEVRLFPLSANQSEIGAAVQRYRKKLEGPPEILEASNDGSALYKMLVEPAQDFLKKEALAKIGPAKNSNIFIIPDGGLNNLNFETLVPENTVAKASASQPKRYWIEDVTIANAASLGLLPSARGRSSSLGGNLLLIGNSVAPFAGAANPYPELPNSAVQMENIEKYFPSGRRQVFARERATPAAYLNSHPENFSYIHFVAHGLASRSDPLDSTIILSRDPASNDAQDESFKLYARNIIAAHPLRAELVTISACQSTGTRTYSGEGLVGLSWAFLQRGARNVVGALWDVSDASTARLMDNFYGELKRGRPPEVALRSAKLAMLHTNEVSRRPFYWAPFQLYTGGR